MNVFSYKYSFVKRFNFERTQDNMLSYSGNGVNANYEQIALWDEV